MSCWVFYESFIHPIDDFGGTSIRCCWCIDRFGDVWQKISPHRNDRYLALDRYCEKNAIMMIDFALDAQRNRACRQQKQSVKPVSNVIARL